MPKRKYYYNTPRLPENISQPAAAAGCLWLVQDDGTPALHFIIRRDLHVRIRSFTFLYRFSSLSIQYKDSENPFYRFEYTPDSETDKPFFVLYFPTPDITAPRRCTAVISSITLESGETLTYYPKDFIDPVSAEVRSPADAEGYLKEYFAYRSAPAENHEKSSVPAAAPGIPKRRRKLRRETVQFLSGAAVFLLIAGLLAGVIASRRADSVTRRNELSDLLADHQYSEAYRLVQADNDPEALQNLCRQAAAHFLTQNDYEKSYLYASAAPWPFPEDVVNVFIGLLLRQDRHEEAFDFLKEQSGDYSDTLQKVCLTCVNRSLAAGDFAKAYTYAKEAPVSLEADVVSYLSAHLISDGYLSDDAYSILENMENDSEFDSVARQTIKTLCAEKKYSSAAVMACQIRSADTKAAVMEEICSAGMRYYMEQDHLDNAVSLLDTCASGMSEAQRTKCLRSIADYCRNTGHTGGTVYFWNQLNKNTKDITVAREDLTLRSSLSKSYFLLTAAQKRAYHAVPLSLYKEAWLIRNGELDGTNITNAVSVSTSAYQTVVLRTDGSVTALNTGHGLVPQLPADKDFVQVACGQNHVLLLRENGRVKAVGSNTDKQCTVSSWRNIVKIAAGADFSVGLRSNGTLVAVGSNRSGQCDVREYRDVVDIAACDQTLVMLFADGTVKLAGDISMGLKEAESFTDIRRIRAAGTCIIGEKANGTYVMASGAVNADCGSVRTWRNHSLFAAGSLCIGYADKNGNIIVEGDGAPVVHQGYETNG